MIDTTTFVGLDVHARSIKAVALDIMTGEVRTAAFGHDAASVAQWIGSIDAAARCMYESGVTGLDLQKKLSDLGVDCIVGAVSKMIKPAADRRRKNDRNAAEFLARMLSAGNVVEVWAPDDECEAARDLTRALEDARDDLKRSKQRLSKFLLRHGLVFDEKTPSGQRKKNWTQAWWSWARSISFAERADNEVLSYYIDDVKQAAENKARLEGLVKAEAGKPRWKRRVDSLCCLKGIDVMTAADLVFEAGEFSRFKNARSFAAWVGLTPSEHSSGKSVRKGASPKPATSISGKRWWKPRGTIRRAPRIRRTSPKDGLRTKRPEGMRPRAYEDSWRGGGRCWNAGCIKTKPMWPRRANPPVGYGPWGSWRKRAEKRGPPLQTAAPQSSEHKPITLKAVGSEAVEANPGSFFASAQGASRVQRLLR